MHHHSFRGLGIRYWLALTLPIAGIMVVLYTIAQLFGVGVRERRSVTAPPAGAVQGSMAPSVWLPPATATAPQPEHTTAPKK